MNESKRQPRSTRAGCSCLCLNSICRSLCSRSTSERSQCWTTPPLSIPESEPPPKTWQVALSRTKSSTAAVLHTWPSVSLGRQLRHGLASWLCYGATGQHLSSVGSRSYGYSTTGDTSRVIQTLALLPRQTGPGSKSPRRKVHSGRC